jgi:hypothetical protein
MKLIGKTLNYIINTNEELGMFTEKIICDIVRIKFNSKRNYINEENYPFKLRRDLEMSLGSYLRSLNIKEHLGHINNYYDFVTTKKESISIKTNISGSKICPQTIGQVSLENFNAKTDFNFKSVLDYKKTILKNPNNIINTYLQHLFCCNLMLSFKYDQAKVYCFESKQNISLQNAVFNFSKTLQTWQSSMSMGIQIGNVFRPLCEFQIHTSRNCIKCRFNLDTIILLIQKGMIKNVFMKELDLKYKYQIRVTREIPEEIEVPEVTKKRKLEEPEIEPEHKCKAKANKKRNFDDDDYEYVES